MIDRFKDGQKLIIAGLIVLLVTLSVWHLEKVSRFSDETQTLRAELEQVKGDLAQVTTTLSQETTALSQERAKIFALRELRHFSSLDELKEFLSRDKTDKCTYVKGTFDCDDFARMLQENALEEGYLINCQRSTIHGVKHMLNMAFVGNDIYYIEASTDGVMHAGYIDRR